MKWEWNKVFKLIGRKIGIPFLILLFLFGCQEKEGHTENRHDGKHEKQKVKIGSEVYLSNEVIKNLSLKWAKVEKKSLYHEISVTGKVIQDTEHMTYVFAQKSGMVQDIYVGMGQWVAQGKPLIQINNEILKSPSKGTILSVNVSRGATVTPMQSLFAIAKINPIQVVLDVYPKDMDRVSLGQRVRINLIGHGHKHEFFGKIKYISPNLDEQSQTLKVSALVRNTDQHLKFGMFVQGKILTRTRGETLVVPEEALLRFGREYAVFLLGDKESVFQKREVRIGERGNGQVEILAGLEENEQVVTQGNFILKSESLKSTMGEEHAH